MQRQRASQLLHCSLQAGVALDSNSPDNLQSLPCEARPPSDRHQSGHSWLGAGQVPVPLTPPTHWAVSGRLLQMMAPALIST